MCMLRKERRCDGGARRRVVRQIKRWQNSGSESDWQMTHVVVWTIQRLIQAVGRTRVHGGRQKVRQSEDERADAGDQNSFADPDRNMAMSAEVADKDDRTQVSDFKGGRNGARHFAWHVESFFNGGDDTVKIARTERLL